MNRHRDNWSVMGIEPSTERRQSDVFHDEMVADLRKYASILGTVELVSECRKLVEEFGWTNGINVIP